MASTSFFARVTLPAPSHNTSPSWVRYGVARGSYRRVLAAAMPPRRTLGSALREEEAQIAVLPSVHVPVGCELQLAGPCAWPSYTLHFVLTEGEFGGAGHPA
ncbi:uncharacterized protein [Lolium perenne]|uniref:uncharacterized protein n=1 Tax=Lolium perenne TaxID=4522 RepID=UPI0021EB02FC|nr:uncharacterized protein LOC127309865 [Lolium perenne]